MGWNSVLLVMNDALGGIQRDPAFGDKLASAIARQHVTQHQTIDISSGMHVNAATVLGQQHADVVQVWAVGGNCGLFLGSAWWTALQSPADLAKVEILRKVAADLGYTLTKKRGRK